MRYAQSSSRSSGSTSPYSTSEFTNVSPTGGDTTLADERIGEDLEWRLRRERVDAKNHEFWVSPLAPAQSYGNAYISLSVGGHEHPIPNTPRPPLKNTTPSRTRGRRTARSSISVQRSQGPRLDRFLPRLARGEQGPAGTVDLGVVGGCQA